MGALISTHSNLVRFNKFLGSGQVGIGVDVGLANYIQCNDFARNGLGIRTGGLFNTVVDNNFFVNDTAIDLGFWNFFERNYWEVNAPNCVDADGDGFCDAPYVFAGNQDGLPRVNPVPWELNPAACDPFGLGFVGGGGTQQDESAIAALHATWFDALESGDVELAATLLTEDVVMMPPGSGVVSGKDAVVAYLQARVEEDLEEDWLASPDDVVVAGAWALVGGRAISTRVEDDQAVRRGAKFLMVLHRQQGEAWRIARMMWNFDEAQ